MRVLPAMLSAWVCLAACHRNAPAPVLASFPAPAPGGAYAAAPGHASSAAARDVRFVGMCDASGAVPLDAHTFAVADDEDNVLRVYDADRGGAFLYAKDVSSGLGILPKPRKHSGKPPKPPAEADLEAATMHAGQAYWLTSHGRNSKGKSRPERLRFFATTAPDYGQPLTLVGRAYTGLVADLQRAVRFAGFGLEVAAQRAPKEPGGLNIEGLTERIAGGMFIGFRSPTPRERALLVVLLNPEGVMVDEPARFADPILLDLQGLGVRGLSSWRGQYLIIAGHHDSSAPSRLFRWDGESTTVQPVPVDLSDFNPEGFFTPEDRDVIMLLSDDGANVVNGTQCKKLDDPDAKSFRGRWVELPTSPSPPSLR